MLRDLLRGRVWSVVSSGHVERTYGDGVALFIVRVGGIVAEGGVFLLEGVCAQRVAVHGGRGGPWRVWRHRGGTSARGEGDEREGEREGETRNADAK